MTGRPRDRDLEERLLAAGWEILTEQGYDQLTLAKVARLAQAHRTDVYRRWSSKAQLVAQVLSVHLPPISDVDTGTLSGDVRTYVEDLAASWSSPWIDGLIGLVADLQRDMDAELAFRQLGERRGDTVRRALTRAVERGELAQLPDPGLVGDLLEGPLMHRRLIGRQPLTAEYLDTVTAAALRVLHATVPS